ncbi:hypothetical protein N9059_00420 [bacterium]|nr:hypothetical protein [bacterium]
MDSKAKPEICSQQEPGRLLHRLSRIDALLMTVLLAVSITTLWTTDIWRPLEQDEMQTVKVFSSFPYDIHRSEIDQLGTFNVVRAFKGYGKCFLNPWDPNNHVLNSLSVTTSCFLFGFGEVTPRLPAWTFGTLASLLLYLLCLHYSKSRGVAFLLSLILLTNPTFALYMVMARGYTLTILLILILTILFEPVYSGRANNNQKAVFILATMGTVLNLLSTLVSWMIPFFFAGYWLLFKQRNSSSNHSNSQEKKRKWYHPLANWMTVHYIASFVIILFLLINKDEISKAQQLYGEPVEGIAQVFIFLKQVLFEDLHFNFITLALGLFGIFTFKTRAPGSWLLVTFLGIIALVFIQGLLSGKLGFARTYVHLLPLLLLGMARATGFLIGAPRYLIAAALVFHLIYARAVTYPGDTRLLDFYSYSDLSVDITNTLNENNVTSETHRILLPQTFGEEMRFYLPSEDSHYSLPSPGDYTLILPCEWLDEKWQFKCIPLDRSKDDHHPLPIDIERFKPMFSREQKNVFQIQVGFDLFDQKSPPSYKDNVGFWVQWDEPSETALVFKNFALSLQDDSSFYYVLQKSGHSRSAIILTKEPASLGTSMELLTKLNKIPEVVTMTIFRHPIP